MAPARHGKPMVLKMKAVIFWMIRLHPFTELATIEKANEGFWSSKNLFDMKVSILSGSRSIRFSSIYPKIISSTPGYLAVPTVRTCRISLERGVTTARYVTPGGSTPFSGVFFQYLQSGL